MRLFFGSTLLLALFLGVSVLAADNPYAGTWKFNTAKSKGATPTCLDNGLMVIPPDALTSASAANPDRSLVKLKSANCFRRVYKFTASQDGQTLTLTQPQIDPNYKAVFDRQ
jgi:hypothetical protein